MWTEVLVDGVVVYKTGGTSTISAEMILLQQKYFGMGKVITVRKA